jgi:hypothetical protein
MRLFSSNDTMSDDIDAEAHGALGDDENHSQGLWCHEVPKQTKRLVEMPGFVGLVIFVSS